jgi:ATP-binding cassette subfamily B (MDR/TAP) protein 1
MDVFTSSDLVKGGDFVSLLYFVIGLGALVLFFVMGWISNIIAQVSSGKETGSPFCLLNPRL